MRNHKKIRRLMREHDLRPKRRRRFAATTDRDHDGPVYPNRAREVAPDHPNQLWWAGDDQAAPADPTAREHMVTTVARVSSNLVTKQNRFDQNRPI